MVFELIQQTIMSKLDSHWVPNTTTLSLVNDYGSTLAAITNKQVQQINTNGFDSHRVHHTLCHNKTFA